MERGSWCYGSKPADDCGAVRRKYHTYNDRRMVRKKNKKVSPAPKPFWVLSRRAVAGWVVVILFIGGWMFVIGVMVGRDESPVKFNINSLQNDLKPLRDQLDKESAGPTSRNPDSGAGKTDLDFYEALPENREDANITAKPQPSEQKLDVEPSIPKKAITKKPPGKRPAPKTKQSMKRLTRSRPKPKPQASTSASQVSPTGQRYTIQVAAFKQPGDADKLVAKLKQKGFSAHRAIGKVPGKGIWYRVRVGEYNSRAEARKTMANLKKEGHKPALVVK